MLRPIIQSPSKRNVSFNFFKNWGTTCEKVESTKPSEPHQKYVIEKSCCPSIFETWRPKVPDLSSAKNYPSIKENLMLPYKRKSCTPGMKFREKSRCELDALAKECQKLNHPKWLRHCPPKPKNKVDGPLPPIKAAMSQCKESGGKVAKKPVITSLRKKCDPQIPEGDWNPDGFLG